MFTEWFLLVAAEPEERCGSVEHSETAESGSGKHCLKMIYNCDNLSLSCKILLSAL